jgi:2-isopropylmalate synthase
MVKIVDATLREGRQAPGVQFGQEQTLQIAKLLAELAVDQIECGHPSISMEEMERVRATVGLGLDCQVLTHARACERDIEAAAASGAPWVGIFIGINELSRRTKLSGAAIETVLSRIEASVRFARSKGLKVRFTLEDASRTELQPMVDAYRAAVRIGADRLCFADTVGLAEPKTVASVVAALRGEFPGVDIELHMHNDRGLAMANCLAGIDAGATWISTSVNGLGERAGIADLSLVLANLHARGSRPLQSGNSLPRLSRYVAAFSRNPVSRSQPVVGRSAFQHTARLHVKAMDIDQRAYSWFSPEIVGAQSSTTSACLPCDPNAFIIAPQARGASELRYHRDGHGTRYLMIDERLLPDCRQYCIVREIPPVERTPEAHVDLHRHDVDSLFLFLGRSVGLQGLTVEVQVGSLTRRLDSPASVFVPAGLIHSYRIVSGSGFFINHVLSGSYNQSLLE